MLRLKSLIALWIGAVMACGACYASEPIQTFDQGSFEQIKAARSGRPFVLMLWSLDCAYCDENFSALAQLQRTRGIEVITVAMDRITDNHTAELIRKKIRPSGLKSEMWSFGDQPVEQLRYSIDPKWRGEMPRTYWFTNKGKGKGYSGVVTTGVAEKFM